MSYHNTTPYSGTLSAPGQMSSRSSERTLGYDNQATAGHMKVPQRPTKVSPNWQPHQHANTEHLISQNNSFRKQNRADVNLTVPDPGVNNSNNNSSNNTQNGVVPQQHPTLQQQGSSSSYVVSQTAPTLLSSTSSSSNLSFNNVDGLLNHGLDTSTPTSSLKSLQRIPHNQNLLSDRSFPPVISNGNGNAHHHHHSYHTSNQSHQVSNSSTGFIYGNNNNNNSNNNNNNNNNMPNSNNGGINATRANSMFIAGTITPVASSSNSQQLASNIPKTPSYGYFNPVSTDYYNSPQSSQMYGNGKDLILQRGGNGSSQQSGGNNYYSFQYGVYHDQQQQQQQQQYTAHMPKYVNMQYAGNNNNNVYTPLYNTNNMHHHSHHHHHHHSNNNPNDALTNALLKKGLKRKKRSTTPMQLKKSKHENAPKRICISCRARQSSYWREPWHGAIACNACTLRYKKRSLACEHCLFIPFKHNDATAVCPSCKLGKFSNPEGRPLPPHIRMLIEPSGGSKATSVESTEDDAGDLTLINEEGFADDDDDNEDEQDEQDTELFEPKEQLELEQSSAQIPMLDIPVPTKLDVVSVPSSYERTSHLPSKPEITHSHHEM